ncbi:HDOD domain-containing protein [Dechloromonas denitrificans]|uniref:HDOD domain-containing protein n=1 Tax=Dechloromonas denitrificans TaxID=281362 RepID=UPI001CF86BC3|nr:HDOD domain-containing protein [Dechloromonas denitrificans]UCV05507.1 HDOD domain-containing protein [Dechloromonas denitrificans]
MYKLPEPIIHAIESGRVPSPPQLLLRLLQMVDDERTTMGELATLVEQDPGLATRILSVANSPALTRGSELRSLEGCLVALGTRLVRSIATCLSIQGLFDRRAGTPAIDLSRFWSHSLLVAEISRGLASATGYPHPEEAYLGGLLHDIGELILLSALGEPYAQLLASCSNENALPPIETAQFGVHHGEIGTWLTEQWHLDSMFADGILFHHASPEQIVTATALPQLVWLAHALAASEEISPELDLLQQKLFATAGSQNLAQLRDQAEARTRLIAEALDLHGLDKVSNIRVWEKLKFATPQKTREDDAEEALSAMIGGMALLQPLQQDLFTLESDAEVLLSLRESARILFDLNRVAFLLCTSPDGTLSGASIGGQPALFRQVDIPLEENHSLLSNAALQRQICSSFDAAETPQVSLIDIQFARAFATPGLLCIPMIARNRVTGVMVCGLSQSQHARLSRRLPWLLNFGRIAAISLETLNEARSYRQQAEQEASSRFTRQARRIVHEAGNPLGIIKSYLMILDRKLPEETGVRQELEILTEEIDRVASIVGRMSEIPAEQPIAHGHDVGELINELLLLYREPLFHEKGIRVETSQPAEPLRVLCERDSLKQILLNLWKNASEALTSGQQIRISLTDHVVHNGNTYIQVRMDDNGPGMSETAMRSIHHAPDVPSTGKRGIGLSIVGELASRQAIPITCRSQAGKGTSIALLLPKFVVEATPLKPRPGTSDTALRPLSGTETK